MSGRRGERPRDLAAIAARKRELIERADAQRRGLADVSAALAPALARADHALAVGRSVLRHPLVLVGAGVLVLVVRPRALASLAGRGLALWSGFRAARRVLASHG